MDVDRRIRLIDRSTSIDLIDESMKLIDVTKRANGLITSMNDHPLKGT